MSARRSQRTPAPPRLKGSRSRPRARGRPRPHSVSHVSSGARRLSPERVWWTVAILLLTTALVYANSLSGPFVFDDRASIAENASIRTWSVDVLSPDREVPTAGRPVVNLSLAINF